MNLTFLITLILIIFFLTFSLDIGKWLSNIISGLMVLGAISFFITSEIYLGIVELIIDFLLSPYGLTLIEEKLVFGLGKITVALKSI